ncbi:MAG: helix-turn-helix domain-containing protein [Actinomycetota bacterium]|nr:helix-turn-helix domain-containing protein [Actinomycetota bacterium]
MGGATASSDTRNFLGSRLLASTNELVSAIDGGQLYGLLRVEEIAEVARTTERIVDLIVRALIEQKALNRGAQRFLRRLGTRRAEQGVALESVTAAFERATKTGLDVMKAAALDWPDHQSAWDAFVELAGGLFALVQAATNLVRDGYEDWERGAATGRAREDVSVVEDMFEGRWATAEEMIERARALGYPLTNRCLLVTALPLATPEAGQVRDSILAFASSIGAGLVVGLLRGTPVRHVPFLVPVTDEATQSRRKLDAWARESNVVAVVALVDDMTLVPRTYTQMRDELALVLAAVRTPGAVDHGRSLHVPRLLQSVQQENVEAFIRPTLGGVLAQPPTTAERLLDTLAAVFAWRGSMKRLATSLALSHSGLRTRLSRVSELTQRHHNRDRVELVLALLLFRIHRLRLPALGDPRWVT